MRRFFWYGPSNICLQSYRRLFAASFTIASLYPDATRDLEQGLKKCTKISGSNFRKAKVKICQFVELTSGTMRLDQPFREHLLSILVESDLRSVQDFLRTTRESSSPLTKIEYGISRLAPGLSRMLPKGRENNHLVIAEEAAKETFKATQTISDSQFLSDIVKTDVVQESLLKPLAEEAHEMAMSYLKSTISDLVEKLVFSARSHLQRHCMENVNTEILSLKEREQHTRRSQFIREINQASIQDSV